jgi:small-conductance mechanosensitive channel
MHLSPSRLFLIFLLSFSSLWMHLAVAADPAPAASSADAPVTASQAKRVLGTLQDDKRRAELEETLRVISQATAAAPGADAPAEEAPAEAAPIALVETGVVAQIFDRVGNWFDAVGNELKVTGRTFLEVRTIGIWWESRFGTDEARANALRAIGAVLVILAAGLAVEWLLRRVLQRPRDIVAAHAARRFATEEAKRTAAQSVVVEAPAVDPAAAVAPGAVTSPSGLTASTGAPAAASPAAAASAATPGVSSTGAPISPITLAAATSADAATEPAAPPRQRYDRHWGVLRRIPYAVAYGILKWLPLLGFLGTTSLLIALSGGPNSAFYRAILPLVGAYAATRVTMSAMGVLITPAGAGLRLAPVTNDTARYLRRWFRRIVVVAVFGAALTDVALAVGATGDAQNAMSKLIALAVHLMVITVIFQSRHRVGHWIRGSGQGRDSIVALRALLADIWAPALALFVVGLWVVWALGVNNGFQQLLHYFALTAGVLFAAVVTGYLALGALDKTFFGSATEEGKSVHVIQHYQRFTQRAVIAIVVIVALLTLLQVWGFSVLNWFAPGTIGRSLLSAVSTIAVACILAIVAWEGSNFWINRRIALWTGAGDVGRATRLRTLVPIMRTTLFIVIALVVVLTALNQLGINIAPLLAGASIVGVALGFGSQKLVQDFITGIFLLVENAMQVGDSVTVAGVSGVVENLSIRTVRLRAGDGALHVIPFSSVSLVTNTNRGIGNAAIRLSVRADEDLDRVIAAIQQVGAEMRQDPQFQDAILADLDLWGVDQVDGATITLAGQIRTTDRGRWGVQRGFNQRIWRRFRELGIQLTNPQETVVINPLAAPKSPDAAAAGAAPGGADAGAAGPAGAPTAAPAAKPA